ncbi:MAG: caspase family protein [Pseudomonadota bacterium]
MRFKSLLVLFIGLLATKAMADMQQRSALVIGNSAYHQEDLVLDNPAKDATDLAKVLRRLGFEVVKKTNLSQREMKTAITQFSNKLRDNKGVGLFYFSGHGIQHKGVNYMLPVDVESLKETWQLPYETVPAGYILDSMEAAENKINIIILDACRNLPEALKKRAKGDMMQGLSMEMPIPGSVIAYAAAPGGVASVGCVPRTDAKV